MRDGSKTKARIEAEALRLFAEKGVDGTSIRDIATAAGIAEGALYRHFPGKEALSRSIFLKGYAALAQQIAAAARLSKSFDEIVFEVICIFCNLFDENKSLFSFLLIAQHTHLNDVPVDPQGNVVAVVYELFAAAMQRGDIPRRNADELTAIALGAVAQPAIFTLYGRLQGPMRERSQRLAQAVLGAARGDVLPGQDQARNLPR